MTRRGSATATLLLLASCGSPIVGAECRAGWLDCDGICIEVQNDPHNCGACGHECGPFECSGGVCGPLRRPDAGGPDASMSSPDGGDGGGAGMPSIGKGGVGLIPDGGFPGCEIGRTDCGGACADTLRDRMHCGECGTQCSADQYCIEGMCKDICDLPLHPCMHACVDYQTDENNCGSCGNVCASGICVAGRCGDTFPGSLFVIGHDYSASTASTPPVMKRLAGNAVLLTKGTSVRVAVYRGKTTDASFTGVRNAIDFAADENGQTWKSIAVSAARVTQSLREVNTFVILPQQDATDPELTALGQQWSMAMAQFLLRGGVIVLFDAPSSRNKGTYQVLEPAALFTATARERIANKQTLTIDDPTVAVTLHLTTSPYQSKDNTVHFLGVGSDGIPVVKDPGGDPVVIFRVVVP
jgi:hypothetical protein